jgi:hypothetical protein
LIEIEDFAAALLGHDVGASGMSKT